MALVFSALDVFVRMGCEFSNNMHIIPSMMIYSAIWMCIAGRTSCLFVNRPLLHPFVVELSFRIHVLNRNVLISWICHGAHRSVLHGLVCSQITKRNVETEHAHKHSNVTPVKYGRVYPYLKCPYFNGLPCVHVLSH